MGLLLDHDGFNFDGVALHRLSREITDVDSSQLALSNFWEYLRGHEYCGFGYYLFDIITSKWRYKAGYHETKNADQIAPEYALVLDASYPADFIQRSIAENEGRDDQYLICPVYGPCSQNAVFVVEVQSPTDKRSMNFHRGLETILQQVHIVASRLDSFQRKIEFSLSPRETEVLNLIPRGLSNRQISDVMQISVYTVNTYVRNIMLKLGVNDRGSLCMKWLSISGVPDTSS